MPCRPAVFPDKLTAGLSKSSCEPRPDKSRSTGHGANATNASTPGRCPVTPRRAELAAIAAADAVEWGRKGLEKCCRRLVTSHLVDATGGPSIRGRGKFVRRSVMSLTKRRRVCKRERERDARKGVRRKGRAGVFRNERRGWNTSTELFLDTSKHRPRDRVLRNYVGELL